MFNSIPGLFPILIKFKMSYFDKGLCGQCQSKNSQQRRPFNVNMMFYLTRHVLIQLCVNCVKHLRFTNFLCCSCFSISCNILMLLFFYGKSILYIPSLVIWNETTYVHQETIVYKQLAAIHYIALL